MIPLSNRTLSYCVFIITLLCILAALAPPYPVQAGPDLPPRDPPPATPLPPSPDKDKKDKDSKNRAPLGAYIELQAQPVSPSDWSVVQWQDSAGGWHEVEGWRGPLPDNTRWWVAAKDFGAGPFRWVIQQGPGGPLLGQSPPFSLPQTAGETVRVTVGP